MVLRKKHHVIIALVVSLFLSFQWLSFAETSKAPLSKDVKPVVQKSSPWLLLGPAEIPSMADSLFKSDATNILNFNHISVSTLQPIDGADVPWYKNQVLKWKPLTSAEFKAKETSIFYLATYLEPSRWLQTQLVINNNPERKVAIYLDGKSVNAQPGKDKITADLDLSNEKHLLVIKSVIPKGSALNPEMNVTFENKEAFKKDMIAMSSSPVHKTTPANVINMVEVSSLTVSPDGKLVAVFLRQTDKESGKPKSWMEILNIATGAVVYSTNDLGSYNSFDWMGSSDKFLYTVSEGEDVTSIYSYNLATSVKTPVLRKIKDFSYYALSPDQSYLVYAAITKSDASPDYKAMAEMRDRTESGDKNKLFIYFLNGGASHQITNEEQNFGGFNISPDGKYIILSRSDVDNKNRPFFKNVYYIFDVNTMSMKPLLESNLVNSLTWCRDSKHLIAIGGPSSFDGIGKNLKDPNQVPNDMDNQAFIFDIDTQKAEPITKNFDPSVDGVFVNFASDNIYFRATDKADVGIFAFSAKDKSIKKYQALINVVSGMDIAQKQNVAVYYGTSPMNPIKLYKLDLNTGKAALLKDYNADYFKYVRIGNSEEWNYKMPGGYTVHGRVHYPADFDKTKTYPCIVYYYAGTTPVTNDYGGRYPKDWYTANGYIVYVLQPRGTVGFGQDFSAVHVNDWGKETSVDIITCVKEFLKAHPFVDPKRVGAMGASYGGFMTQYLATQTDIFAAYISHAGITSLTSYWGGGDYGVWYNSQATADSYPWNRKDIYIGHSPLFMADQIKNPLLLLHGDADNNVPPAESYQMFSALKILGKDVFLVTYKDQQHFIGEYKKRIHWMNTIIAWWDKHLKGQPEHWDFMYKKK